MVAVMIVLMWRYMLWRWLGTLPPAGVTLDYLVGVIFALIETACMAGTPSASSFSRGSATARRDADRNVAWLADAAPAAAGRRLHLHLQRGSGDPRAHHRRRAVDGLRPTTASGCSTTGGGRGCRSSAQPAGRGLPDAARQRPCQGRQHQQRPAARRRLCPSRPTSSRSSTPTSCRPRSSCGARSACSARTTSASCRRRSTSSIPIRCRPISRSPRVWPDEQRYFFDVVMASKDAWGAAFCCGTSSVIRFPALQRIGGFPTDSVTEDYLVTLKLKRGRLPHRLPQRAALARPGARRA